MSIEKIAEYIKENKATIVWQLYTCKYQSQPVCRVKIPKANGGTKNLGIPIFFHSLWKIMNVNIVNYFLNIEIFCLSHIHFSKDVDIDIIKTI